MNKNLVIFCILLLGLNSCKADKMNSINPKQPNVLFLIADDLNTALSGFGHPQCKTPNLDKLASRGMRFESAYCQFPLCGPSRASIMTGLYPHNNGVLGNAQKFRKNHPDIVTMSELFKNNGYWAGRVSKIYHQNIPDEVIAGTCKTDDNESWSEYYNIQAPEQNSPGKKVDHSPKINSSQTFMRVESDGDDLLQADGKSAEKAMELLEKHGNEPFFLAVGFVRPHVPFVAPKKYFEPYPTQDMVLPIVPENDLEDIPKVRRDYKTTEFYGMDEWDQKGTHAAYYASVAFMDAQVGKILNKLDELGLSENTIVVFTSDHGYNLGEHHKWQKQHLFEETTRVPFIVSIPWEKKTHGQATQKITELVDLYPTLADYAGLKAPISLDGTSLRVLLEDSGSKEWEKDEAFTVVSRSNGSSIRTKEWRYIEWDEGKKGCELYDLTNDPGEFTNVSGKSEYAIAEMEMKKLLGQRRKDAGYVSKNNKKEK